VFSRARGRDWALLLGLIAVAMVMFAALDVREVFRHLDEDKGGAGAARRIRGGQRRGHPPTGRRFENVDEVYIFRFSGDRIAGVWGIEDTLDRFRQLGLDPS
jgi:hypothetical protein